MRQQTLTAALLALVALATAPALPAQNLEMAQPTAASAATPTRGQSMAQVERLHGAPTERFPAVGQPPITRWVYPTMVVFFEYDHVVHAVTVRR